MGYLGLEKCGQIVVKYLSIPCTHRNHNEEIRTIATSKYHPKIRHILNSQLNEKNRIYAINLFTLLIIRYSAGIVS